MTPMKLSDPEIVSRVILTTVDGNGLMAKRRESQLKDTTWREMQIREFTNTQDSAWSIVDTMLSISPIKLCYIQDELDAICATFPKAKGDRMIKKDDNIVVGALPTDIVIPCDSIHRSLSYYHYLLIPVLWAQPELEKALYASYDLESIF